MSNLIACGNHGACGGLGETKAQTMKHNPAQALISSFVGFNNAIPNSPNRNRELFFTNDKPDAALAFSIGKTIPQDQRLSFLIQTKQTLANLWNFLKVALPLEPRAKEEFEKIESKIALS